MTLRKVSKLERFLYGLCVVTPAHFIAIVESLVGIALLGWYTPSWSLSWYGAVAFPFTKWFRRTFDGNS